MLIILLVSLGLSAQNQSKMENDSITNGRVIKRGKLVYTEIHIKASVEKVWKEFTDFNSYSSWNPFIKSLTGEPKVGNKIQAILQPPGKNGMTFKPRVLVYDSLHQFRWIGSLRIGRLFDGEHAFILRAREDGTTTFIQFERFRGILVPLMKKMLDNNTKEGFTLMNEALKKRCEK